MTRLLLIAAGALAIIAAIGGGIWYINDSAYDRGRAEVIKKQVEDLAKRRDAIAKDAEENRGKSESEIEAEFKRRCLEAGGSVETCG